MYDPCREPHRRGCTAPLCSLQHDVRNTESDGNVVLRRIFLVQLYDAECGVRSVHLAANLMV